MFEELADKVRKDLYEEMGLAFEGKSSPDMTPHKDSVDPLVEFYMTSFMKTLLKEYRRESNDSPDHLTEHAFDNLLSALRRKGIPYKLSVPPLRASLICDGIKLSFEQSQKYKRIYFNDHISSVLTRWDPAIVDLLECIVKEYRWAYSLDFLANYRERCECHCRQRMVVKNMIQSTVNPIISDCPKEMLCVVTDVKACSNGKVIVQLMSIHYDTATSIRCHIANLPKCIEKALLRLKHHGKHDSNRKDCQSAPASST